MIENFRQAAGLGNIFRSATTDVLGELSDASELEGSDAFIAKKPGLILDLRSTDEVNLSMSQKWIAEQGIQLVEYDSYQSFEKKRSMVRMNMLSKEAMRAYMAKEWMSATELESLKSASPEERKAFMFEKLNEHGILGLNKVILDSAGADLCKALMILTRRFEANADDVILIHCVHGKDRTGMLVMLLQSLTEFSDDIIINDYIASDNKSTYFETAEAESNNRYRELDKKRFARATKEDIVSTLDYLRQKHGSISPGYLEHIGFNNMWRRRLRCCLKVSHSSENDSRMYW